MLRPEQRSRPFKGRVLFSLPGTIAPGSVQTLTSDAGKMRETTPRAR